MPEAAFLRLCRVPPFLQCGRERRRGGFDGCAEFREHGDDAAEHGRSEEEREDGDLAHGECAFRLKK